MTAQPERFSDPNPVFQSVVEACRQKYALLIANGTAEVSCSLSLLSRQDRAAQPVAPLERLRAWAAALGFEVATMVWGGGGEITTGGKGALLETIQPAEIVTVTVRRIVAK